MGSHPLKALSVMLILSVLGPWRARASQLVEGACGTSCSHTGQEAEKRHTGRGQGSYSSQRHPLGTHFLQPGPTS